MNTAPDFDLVLAAQYAERARCVKIIEAWARFCATHQADATVRVLAQVCAEIAQLHRPGTH